MNSSEILSKVKLGMTRAEVFAVLGEADAYNIGSRKYPKPSIYKYGNIELYFHYHKDGGLWMVYEEDANLNPIIHLGGSNANVNFVNEVHGGQPTPVEGGSGNGLGRGKITGVEITEEPSA